ncbi:MAG: hypothetical protein ACLFQS_02625 [Bacteroidales bacterium]
MYKFKKVIAMAFLFALVSCSQDQDGSNQNTGIISKTDVEQTIQQLQSKYTEVDQALVSRGVEQVAALWESQDGTREDFTQFCIDHFAANSVEREKLFQSLSRSFEKLWGHTNQINLELNKPLHLDWGPIQPVDMIFAAYSPGAHFSDDLFNNNIAFITILNFPFYNLEEKNQMGKNWSRLEWAYARMGDVFVSRLPANVNQEIAKVSTESDSYVSEYNIVMDKLIDRNGNFPFPEKLKLITHWGLRDEIKSNYSANEGFEKQEIIYQVMKRIIDQDIPQVVINNEEVEWNPFENTVTANGETVTWESEPLTRYQHLLNNFKAHQKADEFSPNYPTYIQRAFNQGLELSQSEVENIFVELVSSPVMKEVGDLISKRLQRPLEPWDIWYDGFKSRSTISEDVLNQKTRSLYSGAEAFEENLSGLLARLGYDDQRAEYIASKVKVEDARGAGHAWGAQMKSQYSHLRTRIPDDGLDYKGYNIAIHEFGHNVEQTITLYDVDHYLMAGVPNTAFTEAMAFMYQSRDLDLLGMQNNDPMSDYMAVLDNIWGTYEIMGVSLVDMKVWDWMYKNPDASAGQLKDEVIRISKQVWNDYFAPVFGVEDESVLAIYSHMISYPLYLSAYPLGHLIEFQIEQFVEGKNFANETDRMFTVGKLTPGHWMQNAVNNNLSAQPMIDAASEAVSKMNS